MGTAPAVRPIVVLGCPRSGTTLVQVALSAHPRIALPPETWALVDGYRAQLRFGDLAEPAGRDRLADWLLARPAVADLGLTPTQLRAAVHAAPPTLGSALGAVLQAYAARFGKPRWGDKRPGYYRDVAAVRRLLPTAQFVHVVRDARSCVASLKQMRGTGRTAWRRSRRGSRRSTPPTTGAGGSAPGRGTTWRTRTSYATRSRCCGGCAASSARTTTTR